MLPKPGEVVGAHVSDVSLVDFAIWNQSFRDQVPQPCRREWIVFVVVGHAPTIS